MYQELIKICMYKQFYQKILTYRKISLKISLHKINRECTIYFHPTRQIFISNLYMSTHITPPYLSQCIFHLSIAFDRAIIINVGTKESRRVLNHEE